MKLVVVAVGSRMPRWVDEAFAEYAKRMPNTCSLKLIEVRPEPRSGGRTVAQMLAAEGKRIERVLPRGCRRVALDERGREFSSPALARWLDAKRQDGTDIAFIIGGADGLSPAVISGAEIPLRLSAMTLPHGLARVLLAEQLYRALSIIGGHPYHRD